LCNPDALLGTLAQYSGTYCRRIGPGVDLLTLM
jgi:hypothetical protein